MSGCAVEKNILVTGGCGYIGSHVVCLLSEAGYQVVVIDDLSTGFKSALLHGEKLYIGNCGDQTLVERVIEENKIVAVMHFAASIVVPESVSNPLKYYQNNVSNTLGLCKAVERMGVKHVVLSSTAAVYGDRGSDMTPCKESFATNPMNSYGRSKVVDEWVLADMAVAHPDFRYISLRYFNVAGADPKGRIGQNSPKATHLIKRAVQVALGDYPCLEIFGDDYATEDGTCVRDYIHVMDLAAAHLKALTYLENNGESCVLNCGYHRGASVKKVVDTLNSLLVAPIQTRVSARRDGDAPCLVADASLIRQKIDWRPQYDQLSEIILSALTWEESQTGRKVAKKVALDNHLRTPPLRGADIGI